MTWVVEFHQDFDPEFDALLEEVQNTKDSGLNNL
jgi:hypothetical protein